MAIAPLHGFIQANARRLDKETLTEDCFGRPAFRSGDPRIKSFGTPRKQSLLTLAGDAPLSGCLVELGVYRGDTAWRLGLLARTQRRPLHLFDTFRGVPETSPLDTVPVGACADTSFEMVRRRIPMACFHVGVFPASMPRDFESIGFAHVDVPTYRTTCEAIERFTPKLVAGGVILFDDYNVMPAVKKAVDEAYGFRIGLTREGKAFFRQS